jgi:putative transposase
VLRPPIESAQYTSIAFAETLVLERIAASIGSVGDAYDIALAETAIGLFKTEAVGRGSPFLAGPLRTIDDVEYATMEWVDWFNTAGCTASSATFRLRNTRPPITLKSGRPSRRRLTNEAGIKPETVHSAQSTCRDGWRWGLSRVSVASRCGRASPRTPR